MVASDADQLSQEVFDIIFDTSNQIYISSATILEIAIKVKEDLIFSRTEALETGKLGFFRSLWSL